MPHDLLVVDDERAAETGSCFVTNVDDDAVIGNDFAIDVRHEREFNWTESAFATRLLAVVHVREMRINRTSEQVAIEFLKLIRVLREVENLFLEHLVEIVRVEEQHEVLPREVFQAHLRNAIEVHR